MMGSRVLSIGIPPQERTRLCMVASEEVCQQAADYVHRAAQISSEDVAAEPYVRAVYVCRARSVAAERVSVASGAECGSYLRDVLRTRVANAAASGSVPCWLTLTLEDTCIVQHAVFAMSADAAEPQNWTAVLAMQPDSGCPYQPGTVRWSLSAQPTPARIAPRGNVRTPPEAALVAPPAPRGGSTPPSPPPPPAQTSRAPPAPPQQQPQEQPQEQAKQLRPQTAAVRAMGTTPCAHSTRTLAKAMAVATPPPPLPQLQEQRAFDSDDDSGVDEEEEGEAGQPRFAYVPSPPESYLASSAQSSTAPRRDTEPPVDAPSVYDRVAKYRVEAAPDLAQRRRASREASAVGEEGSRAPAQRRHTAPGAALAYGSGAPSESSSAAPSQHVQQQQQQPRARQNRDGLVAVDSPQAELVTPSNGRQWGDLAYRTRYAPRREELWDIANAVMTHNYGQAMIAPGEEPAYIEDRHYEREAEEL